MPASRDTIKTALAPNKNSDTVRAKMITITPIVINIGFNTTDRLPVLVRGTNSSPSARPTTSIARHLSAVYPWGQGGVYHRTYAAPRIPIMPTDLIGVVEGGAAVTFFGRTIVAVPEYVRPLRGTKSSRP